MTGPGFDPRDAPRVLAGHPGTPWVRGTAEEILQEQGTPTRPAPHTPAAGQGRAHRRAARIRSWLVLWSALMLVGSFCLGWFTWSDTHYHDRYQELAAGAWAPTSGGGRVRLTGLSTTDRIASYSNETAPPGSTYLVLEFDAEVHRADDYCVMHVVGRGGRQWKESPGDLTRDDLDCGSDAPLNQVFAARRVIEVPTSEIGRIYGIAVEDYNWRRSPLLRPPG
ncbi:hypothetical protein [Granulicoccus phenolivorans]|uniref:hypothetical protein n=1 Tax=Granulicoccus phenolivorans TaxID=266854 RepID=UPI0003F9D216|nr:hypothetical protein [Granulicoccus phenolivorans]